MLWQEQTSVWHARSEVFHTEKHNLASLLNVPSTVLQPNKVVNVVQDTLEL